MSLVSFIVGKMHVASSNREVCRFIRSKLNRIPRTSKSKKYRDQRKSIYREAIEAHRKNRELVIQFRL